MIELKFIFDKSESISGLSMGYLNVYGNVRNILEENHTPRHRMLLLISTVDLLDGIGNLVSLKSKSFSFVGADSSFEILFKRNNKSLISVWCKSAQIASGSNRELTSDIMRFCQYIEDNVLTALSGDDAVYSDLVSALYDFRSIDV